MNQQYEWSMDSWRKHAGLQIPEYEDQELLTHNLNKISLLPAAIQLEELVQLSEQLKLVSRGDKFLLQIGDCAEVFDECTEDHWNKKFRFFKEMGELVDALVIGRVCGQFAKPRSQLHDDDGILNYRGDLINSMDKSKRSCDPNRLLTGAYYSQNGVQTLQKLQNALFISHECLHLPYEQAFIRQTNGTHYLANTHLPWLGDRTRASHQAHAHFLSGLANPIGVKIGATINEEEFVKIVKKLNPNNVDGRLLVITRLGKHRIEMLKDIVKWKQEHQLKLQWVCDPMHANTFTLKGYKTRSLVDIREELCSFFRILEAENEIPCGIHLEATPHDVVECVDEENPDVLPHKYTTACDPRLNYLQTKNILNLVVKLIKKI